MSILILGCGYTGSRLARRLLQAGVSVIAATREPAKLAKLAKAGARIVALDAEDDASLVQLIEATPPGARVLLSVPTLRGATGRREPTPRLVQALRDRPAHVVYLSTTGVYGNAVEIDETTPVAPVTERQGLRVFAEEAVANGPWSSLILRPAAIYGPGRGVHVRLRQGTYQLAGDGSNLVSRIHVDDLALHCEKALLSEVTGAYPVADEEPSTSREMATFCARLLGLPMPSSAAEQDVGPTRRAHRRVDGSAIRHKLGITLRYPSYRVGVPAALAEETDEPGGTT